MIEIGLSVRNIELTFEHIETNHLSKSNKGCALVGAMSSVQQQQKQPHTNHKFECLYSMFANPPYLCGFAMQCTSYWRLELSIIHA